MKHFKQFLLAVLVALTSNITILAQPETRTVQLNNLVDLDDIAIIGEWTVVNHDYDYRHNNFWDGDNPEFLYQIKFVDNGEIETRKPHAELCYGKMQCWGDGYPNGGWIPYSSRSSSYTDYWINGSMMGRFTQHMIELSSSYTNIPKVARFIITEFKDDDMTLTTYDGSQIFKLKRNYDVIEELGNVDYSNGDYVDLGLPSGLLWSKLNLGATNEHESGDYYAWGETSPNKSVYNESSYTVDWNSMPMEISGTQYDPAYLKLGNGFRMPSKRDFDELIANCTWSYSESEHGYRVTGPNGNSILFPFVGGKEDDYNVGYYPGVYYGQGFYMSGTKSEYTYLYNWYLYMDNDPRFGMYKYNAHRGQIIRPVSTVTSAINSVSYSTNKKTSVYSISGQLEKMNVSPEESLRDLPKGLHIINGTKVMVK